MSTPASTPRRTIRRAPVPPPEPALVDVAGAAARLNVSVRTVWALVAGGDLPRVALGPRCSRFRLEDIDELIESRTARR